MVQEDGGLLTNKVDGWLHLSAWCLLTRLIGWTEEVLRRNGWAHVKVEKLSVREEGEIVRNVAVCNLLLDGIVQIV